MYGAGRPARPLSSGVTSACVVLPELSQWEESWPSSGRTSVRLWHLWKHLFLTIFRKLTGVCNPGGPTGPPCAPFPLCELLHFSLISAFLTSSEAAAGQPGPLVLVPVVLQVLWWQLHTLSVPGRPERCSVQFCGLKFFGTEQPYSWNAASWNVSLWILLLCYACMAAEWLIFQKPN